MQPLYQLLEMNKNRKKSCGFIQRKKNMANVDNKWIFFRVKNATFAELFELTTLILRPLTKLSL